MNKRLIDVLLLFAWMSASADVVHVYTAKSVGGSMTQLGDTTLNTGETFSTITAPVVDGYIFTGWTIDASQTLILRDVWGRSLDAVSFTVYEETTIVANYIANSIDADCDGVPDGSEYYWYGSLAQDSASDTDGDGYRLADELALSLNPLMPDRQMPSGVVTAAGATVQYNPDGIVAWTIRSEPEGLLFATQSDYAKAGSVKTTDSYNPDSSTFAYWMIDGFPQRDKWGRAFDQISFAVGSNGTEVVAVCVTNADERQRQYWYGQTAVAMDSDTDGDGYSFARELALGLNPLMPDLVITPGVVSAAGATVQYNLDGIYPWTIRSEPEGLLFATQSDYAKAGSVKTTDSYNPDSSTFAYWTIDGFPQRDKWGRAFDQISFAVGSNGTEVVAVCVTDADERQRQYWYGQTAVAMDSDTDGDGYSFARELALGLNPLMPDRSMAPGVVTAAGFMVEVDLQIYERMSGAVVDNAFEPLFSNPFVQTESRIFANGSQIWPVVADVNGDGLWDLIVVSATSTNVFVNVGSKGNPQFRENDELRMMNDEWWTSILQMNSTAKLAEMSLDVAPVGALSATTNAATMLVSDADGRIWFYVGGSQGTASPTEWALQHKVWGGSYAGFANGLMLAAVDWEDDGDLDCLCGTAEGKLMLLRDPKVGRPTGLTAAAGVDSVKLEWEPNGQSRVRGYRVYRATGEGTEATEETEETTPASTADAMGEGDSSLLSLLSFSSLSQTSLPRYRDLNLSPATYAYKVSALSRFYTAGNSTPTETESVASEPVAVTVGGVRFFWNDVACKVGETAAVMLSIENALNYNVAGRVQVVSYDPAYLEPADLIPSGLAEGIKYTSSFADGQWTITLTEGVLPAGSGKFFTLIFRTLKSGETTVGEAKVTISSAPTYPLGDLNGDGKVDVLDLRLLAKLKSAAGRKYTSDQLRAGDFNGNGKLDNADYQELRKLLKEKGLL